MSGKKFIYPVLTGFIFFLAAMPWTIPHMPHLSQKQRDVAYRTLKDKKPIPFLP